MRTRGLGWALEILCQEAAIRTEPFFTGKNILGKKSIGENAEKRSDPDEHLPLKPFRLQRSARRQEVILLVDDDESVRELMAMVLEAEGFTVLRARHSQEALAASAAFQGTIHLLLTDFSMKPHLNGFELAQLIRQCRPEIRVVYASGYVEYNVLREEIESATSLFLAKPFSPSSLLDCVRRALGIPV